MIFILKLVYQKIFSEKLNFYFLIFTSNKIIIILKTLNLDY